MIVPPLTISEYRSFMYSRNCGTAGLQNALLRLERESMNARFVGLSDCRACFAGMSARVFQGIGQLKQSGRNTSPSRVVVKLITRTI